MEKQYKESKFGVIGTISDPRKSTGLIFPKDVMLYDLHNAKGEYKGTFPENRLTEVKPKTFYRMDNIGKAKYTINFNDGVNSYKDGSLFFDIRIFSNKKKMNDFIKELEIKGYVER